MHEISPFDPDIYKDITSISFKTYKIIILLRFQPIQEEVKV